MKLNTKCSFNKEQLLTSLSKGLSHIEFHTDYSDFDGSVNFHDIRKILDDHNVTCTTVHAPYSDGEGDSLNIAVGTLHSNLRKRNLHIYKETIKAASILSSEENPVVVSHIGTAYLLSDKNLNNLTPSDISKALDEAEEDLKTINEFIQRHYPGTIFVVENTPKFCYTKNIDCISWYYGTGHDLPEFIKKINLPNIKTCLDVCHMQTTISINKLYNPYSTDSILDYIESYSSTLGLVHLNKAVGLGELTEIHSQPYLPTNIDDINYLVDVFNHFYKLNINCPVTLEINDTDYSTQNNTSLTIKTLIEVSKNTTNPHVAANLTKRNLINL